MADDYSASVRDWEVSSRAESDSYAANAGLSGVLTGVPPEAPRSKINTDTSEGQFDQEMGHISVMPDPASLNSVHSALGQLGPEIENQLSTRPPDESVDESTDTAIDGALKKLFGQEPGPISNSSGEENQPQSNSSLVAQQMAAFAAEPMSTKPKSNESIQYHLIM